MKTNLTRAILNKTNLERANAKSASFDGTDLRNSNVDRLKYDSATFKDASLGYNWCAASLVRRKIK